MNRKADFNIQGFLIGMLIAFGLFIALIGGIVNSLGGNYNIDGFNETQLDGYDAGSSLRESLSQVEDDTDDVTVNENLFDYFAGIWNQLTSPFKTVYRSYRTFSVITGQAASDLRLMSAFTDFFKALLVVLVIVGIVMLKIYLGRQK